MPLSQLRGLLPFIPAFHHDFVEIHTHGDLSHCTWKGHLLEVRVFPYPAFKSPWVHVPAPAMPRRFLSEQTVTGAPGSTTKYTCWVQQAGCSAEGAELEPPKHRKQSRTCRPPGKSTRVRKHQDHSRQSGCRGQGARHSTYTALLQKRSGVKGLSLNTALGEGLVAQVRLVRGIRAC